MRFPRCLAALAVLTALTVAASACGGGNTGPGTTNPTASAPEATAPPTDATEPGTGPVTTVPPATTTTPTQTETQRAGGGDTGGGGEEAVRVPASFVVTESGKLTPPTITVPPFLAVEISIQAADGRAHTLVLQTPQPHTLKVAANQRAAVRIPGLRAGRYAVTLDSRRAGALVAGGEVGP